MEANRTITDGPSKDRLFDACKYTCGDKTTIKCVFSVLAPSSRIAVKYPAIISGIRHEDGSGESFVIEGIFEPPHGRPERFKAYYSTKRRKGVVNEIIT